jgi:hypothetical protein
MSARIENLVTSGTFSLDGGTWDVDNNVWIVGDDSKGSYVLGRCISNPYNAAVNRQCQALNHTGNYTNTGNVLTLAGPNGSFTYR